MTGDGFGGRGWYVAHNYQVGAYSAYTVCGDSNQLYAWGSNDQGQLGSSVYSTISPVPVTGMTHTKFYTTGYVSAAIKDDKTAWVWGYLFPITPIQVLSDVKFVDAGLSHAVFVMDDGTVWGVGLNGDGALGNGTTSQTFINMPVQMTGITNAVRAVAVGCNFNINGSLAGTAATIILLADGTVKVTGGGGWFQSANSTTPVTLTGLNNIVDIKGGVFGAYALNSSGEVYSFGKERSPFENGVFPVLGLGITNGDIVLPTKVNFPVTAAPIVAISANNDGYSCFALDSSHNAYSWGGIHDFTYGQLGDGTYFAKLTPTLVATNVIDIFAGENHSYILKADNSLWATGQSGYNTPLDGSIWMNLPNIQRNVFTQIDPTIPPMNLCSPKVYGVVPIRLLNFTCITVGDAANLNWVSAEEINADKYIVEYSKDGSNFQSIAIIAAKGSGNYYNYVHQQVNGTAFYRLKMIDRDGSFKYSKIRAVKFDKTAGFAIAPNPANGVAYVFTKNNEAAKSVQVFSIDGQLIKTHSNFGNGDGIDIFKLPNGTYILKVIYKNGETEYGRFIKI